MASSGSSYISRRRDKFDSQVHQGNQPYRSNNLHKVDPTLRETFNPDVEESNARSLLQNHTSRDMDPEKTRGSSYSEMDMNDLMGGGLQGGFLKYPIVFIIILYGIGWAAYASMEEWGFVRCIYFITTTITAVGYGDVVPTSQGARFFTTVFAPIGIFLVLLIINTSVLRLYLRAEKRMRKRVTIKGRLTFVALQLADVIFWLFIFSLFLFIGAVIYYVGRGSGDGEHWTYIDALYFCMVGVFCCCFLVYSFFLFFSFFPLFLLLA
jgi:hypothetical protein